MIGEGPERARLQRLAGPTVRFLGWQPDEVIRDHYRRCRALLFPGEEDFGIVPVEALACGAPVIALGRGGAPRRSTPGSAGPTPSPRPRAWSTRSRPGSPTAARTTRPSPAVGPRSYALPVFRDRLLGYLASVRRPPRRAASTSPRPRTCAR